MHDARHAVGFVNMRTGRVKITTVPNRTEPNRTGNGRNHALNSDIVIELFLATLHVIVMKKFVYQKKVNKHSFT